MSTYTTGVTVGVQFFGDDQVSGPESIGFTRTNGLGQIWTYGLQSGDNILLYPTRGYSDYVLWLDPAPNVSGATLTLKANTNDVGVGISSVNPSFVPLSSSDPFHTTGGPGAPPVPSNVAQVILNCAASGTTPLTMGWL